MIRRKFKTGVYARPKEVVFRRRIESPAAYAFEISLGTNALIQPEVNITGYRRQ
jgi:hypothetical protein